MAELQDNAASEHTPIAIIGMGCLFPQAPGLRDYWRLIRWSRDGLTDVPTTHWSADDYFDPDPGGADLTNCRRGGFLSPIEFDPTEFGIPPTTLEATDTAQLLGLVVARDALQDAGYGNGREFDRTRTSVVLGVTGTLELVIPLGARMGHPIWRRALREAGVPHDVSESVVQRIADSYVPWQENSFPGLLGNVVAGRIANRLNLRGTNCAVDAACASSLSAIHLALMELESGRSDMVLTGGVDTFNDIFMFMCFSKTHALSASGDASPFSEDADGTVIGEGVGMVVLKRLDNARRDGDRIYAVIRGVGTSSDGRSQSIYAPRAEGQAMALRNAYRLSGVDPSTVELVEAHGTGTKVGDATEFDALRTVYRQARSEGQWCAIGSVKSQIGHTKAASGVAGLIKSALALHHKVLPATIKITTPNPNLNVDSSPFYLSTETRPWFRNKDHPRRSTVSSFGFGGSNFHVVLEEHAGAGTATGSDAEVAWDGSVQLIALSSATADGLSVRLTEWQEFVGRAPAREALAYRACSSRRAFSADDDYRLVLVVESDADIAKLLADATQRLAEGENGRSWSLPNVFFGGPGARDKVALLFPGQGSQYPGMGRDLVCMFPEAHDAIAQANTETEGDERISDRIYPRPVFDETVRVHQKSELTRTEIAQPAIGAVSLAMWRILRRFGVEPDVVAGHSYGELVALRAARRIDDAALRRLSSLRGRLMAGGDGDRGTMVAVNAPLADLDRSLADAEVDVVLAHRNSPTQGVLSGSGQAIDQAVRICSLHGWRTTRLQVSGAFHSKLMADAEGSFRRALDDVVFAEGSVPVYANRTSEVYPPDDDAARDLLAGQMVSPVDFATEIGNAYAAGARLFVEVGPKSVLTGLVRDILGDRARRHGETHPGKPLPHGRGSEKRRGMARDHLGDVEYDAIAMDAGGGRRSGVTDLARVLARLAASGHRVALAEWEPDCPKPRESRMIVPLAGANYRSPEKRTANKRPAPGNTESSNDNGKTDVSMNISNNGGTAKGPLSKPMATRDTAPLHDALEVVREGLRAMQALQQQTAEVHQRFLEGQESAHKTFQMVMESQQRLIESAAGLPVADCTVNAPVRCESPAPIITERPAAAPLAPLVEPVEPTIVDTPVANDAPSNGDELGDTLLEVVAELTGYPVEMLDLDMDLEADLGIDSIKRVEILAAVETRLPGLQQVDSSYMGSLRTLRNIIEYMKSPAGDVGRPEPAPVGAAAEPVVTDSAGASMKRSVLRAIELPAPSNGQLFETAAGREIWIVDDGTDLASALRDKLESLGKSARVVAAKVDTKGNGIARIGGLIILAPPARSNGEVWDAASERLLRAAFRLTKRIGAVLRDAAAEGGAMFATVSRMDGAFGLVGGTFDPVQGGLAGLTKTVAHEWPGVRCTAFDVDGAWDDAKAAAAAVVRELGTDGPIEVGLGDGIRRGLEIVPTPVKQGDVALGVGDVVLVSGGARGITAGVALALAQASKPTLVLLGRSPAPQAEPEWLAGVTGETEIKRALIHHAFGDRDKATPAEVEAAYRQHTANREISEAVARMQQAGARVLYRSVDVRDQAAVRSVFEEIRDVGPVRALIHAAGTIEDRRIDDKSLAQFERVFDTKVTGLRHLLEAVDSENLKHLVLFSSVSGRYGRQGQVDYAMANEVLNKVAHRWAGDHPSCNVVAINWGPWDGGMVTAALKRDFVRSGIGLIPMEAGARSLVEEMACDRNGDVEVVIGSALPRTSDERRGGRTPAAANTRTDLLPAFERTLDIDRHAFLRSHVIGGHPVLPVAIMHEWLGHAALHDNPGLLLHGFDDFRVLKGVILNNGPCDLRIVASKARRVGDLFEVDVELRTGSVGSEIAHARAKVVLATALPSPPDHPFPQHLDANPYLRGVEGAYNDVLFHGPDFRGIEHIEGYSADGIVARVRSAPAPADWMTDPPRSAWLGDPLVIDAGLQLGILWCREEMNALSLPSHGQRYRQYVSSFPEDGVTALLEVQRTSGNGRPTTGVMTADVAFLGSTGDVIARMEGYTWTVDPSLSAAFGREAVAGAQP